MISCQEDSIPTDENIIYLEPPSEEQKIFEQVLTLRDSFSFDFGEDTNRVVPGVAQLGVNSKDEIFIVNNSRIARFTNKGKFLSDFAGEGKGPGEFIFLIDFIIDQADNVWFYDIGQKRITIFGNKNGSYEYDRSFKVNKSVGKFCLLDSVLIFYSNSQEKLLTAYDYDGNLISEGFETDNFVLRTFLSRFNGGGVCADFDDHSVYAIFPGDYSIHQFTPLLEPLRVIRTRSDLSVSFRSEIPPFPAQLDPFDYAEEQKKWYAAFDHIGNIYKVEPSCLILEMYQERIGEDPHFYFNIYSDQGKVIAENLSLPENTRIAGTHKDKIYLASGETLNSDGSINPVKIYVYQISKEQLL